MIYETVRTIILEDGTGLGRYVVKHGTVVNTVSVIMPVFNGEKYIEKSINSVYRQSYSAIELIIINDGSRDQSSDVLEKMLKLAPVHVSVKVFHQDNHGICYSRNKALDNASGKYVMFIDQDDYMREDCVETLCHKMESDNADMVIGGFDLVDFQGKVLEKWELKPDFPWSKFRITTPWGRIYRKELIDRFHIRFMITKISEDLYFNMLYMSYCKKISITTYRGYFWVYNEQSESHAKMSQMEEDRNPLLMLTELHHKMNQPNILEQDCVEYQVVKQVIWYLFYVAKSAEKNAFKAAYQQCFAWLEQYYPEYIRHIFWRIGFPKGENGKTRSIVKMTLLLKKTGLLPMFLRIYALK